MAATSRWGSTSTSVETSSPFSFRYSRVLRRLEMSFLVGFMARTSTVKPFACQDSKLLRSDSGMLRGHGLPLPGAGHRDGGAGNAPRGPGATVARAGRARLSVEPVLSSEARRRGSQARRRPLARRPAPPAVHDEGRAEAGSGRPSAVGHAAGRSVRRLPARPHDVRDDRTAARVPRHARRLVRLLSLLRALAVGVRDPASGHGHGRVLLRPVDRLLVGVLRGAGHRLSRLSGRRVRDRSAHRRPAHVSDHRARLHAVVRALPGRAGAEEGHRPREGDEDPNHVAHGRAGRLDPGDEGEDRSGVRRQGVRSSRLTEIAAWGFECDARSGLTHVHEDYCYPEVLDEDDRPVGPGGRGELVFTSLYRKAMPLLRYRTRDVVQLADRACPCGRTLVAFDGGVLARLDDMKKIRGIIVYPRRIEELVRPHGGVDEFQIVFRRHEGLDDILLRIDPSPALSLAERDGLRARLGEDLRTGLGIRVTVETVEPGALPRWDHKARRVKDERTEVPF